MKHLFFNCQTLGRRPGCGIVEVGFAVFDNVLRIPEEKRIAGEILISVEQNLRYNRTSDADTLKWWIEQQGGLRSSLRMPARENASMPQLLSELASQWDELWHKEHVKEIWCKRPTFHIDILKSVYDDLGVERPILLREESFRGWNCASTLFNKSYYFSNTFNETMSLSRDAIIFNTRALNEAKVGARRLEDIFITLLQRKNDTLDLMRLRDNFERIAKRLEEVKDENDKLGQENDRLRKSKSKARSR